MFRADQLLLMRRFGALIHRLLQKSYVATVVFLKPRPALLVPNSEYYFIPRAVTRMFASLNFDSVETSKGGI